jgi:hypothetical protein
LWTSIAPIQQSARTSKAFEYGTWGGAIRREFEPQPGDVVLAHHPGDPLVVDPRHRRRAVVELGGDPRRALRAVPLVHDTDPFGQFGVRGR